MQPGYKPGYWTQSMPFRKEWFGVLLFVIIWSGCAGVATAQDQGKRLFIPLKEGWHIKQMDADNPDVRLLTEEASSPGRGWLPASMPAQVHDILLEHKLIPDPHFGKNAAQSAWVGEKDWVYACIFPSPEKTVRTAFLRFGGLDTLAAVYLNGVRIGRFDDMFMEHSAEVSGYLSERGKSNVLLIIFYSPLRYLEELSVPEAYQGLPKYKFLRKCHSDFGSYLGARPHSVKTGIFRDVILDIPARSWLEDVWVRSSLSEDLMQAEVTFEVEIAGERAQLEWTLLDPADKRISRGTVPASAGRSVFHTTVPEPMLWWPWTHGSPNLYRLQVQLVQDNEVVDSRSIAFGIRDVKPVFSDPETGEKRFRFDINGRPVFLQGANWVPPEGMSHCWPQERASRLLELAVLGRMNILRVWAEGHVPPQEFYEECDRRGILIWQDFMFGYGEHPGGNPEFDRACRAEIESMIRRLRNHACLLLWCGGNENHMGWDFAGAKQDFMGKELFHEIMPDACRRLDPTRIFHPSSPYGGPVPNWPLEGDWHDYTTLTFAPEASVPTFGSEVGRASAPSLTSMQQFLSPEDLWPEAYDPAVRSPGQPAWPPMWQYRSVDGSWDKVAPVERFCDPRSAGELIRVLGTAHGEYLRDRVERARRGIPDGAPAGQRRCWGNMVWRLNDSWPILYWSVLDYYLEPKIPFYFLRRAYAPVLLSIERSPDRIAVWIVNDSQDEVAGRLTLRRVDFHGKVLGALEREVTVKPGRAERCLDATPLGPISLRREFLYAEFAGLSAVSLLHGERWLHLPPARVTARTVENRIEISTDVFARQVSLSAEGTTGACFDDNYFDLCPGETRTVEVIYPADARRIRVQALNSEAVVVQRK